MSGRREGVSMCSCEREGVKWMLVEEVSLVAVKCRRMLLQSGEVGMIENEYGEG